MDSSHFINRHFQSLYVSGFITGLMLAFLYASNQLLTGDQTQMLYKGYLGAYQGIWLSFGNAASAVGNVPGTLSALVVGGPLLLWDSPWAPMTFLILLRVVSFFLFDAVIKSVFSQPIRLVFMVLYWLNPWLLFDSLLYNPSYLCFFTALHFWTAFQLREKPSFFYSFLHVLSIGMAMQFHYSWPILAVISVFLLYRKMSYANWIGVLSAGLVLAASLIPYFQEYLANDSLSRESDRYIGYGGVHVYPVLKAVFYWFRYGSTLFTNRIITDAHFNWVTDINAIKLAVQYTWQGFLFIIGGVTVIVSARINWRVWKRIKPTLKRHHSIDDDQHWLLLYSAATVLGIVISAILSPITFSYWHLILTFPIASIPLLIAAEEWRVNQSPRLIRCLTFFSIFFLVVNLVAANDSDKYSHKFDYVEQVNSYLYKEGLLPKQ